MKRYLLTIGYFLLIIIIWQLCYTLKLVSPAAIPSPVEVLFALPSIVDQNEFLPDFLSTISRSLVAFLISIPIGIVSGYIIFYSKWFRPSNELLLDFVRSIPATALIPTFILIFGIDDTTKVAVGTFSSSLIICVSTIQGLKSRNNTRQHISKLIGLKPFKKFIYIDIPESLGHIFVGLRAGVSLALILVVISEMFIGASHGLGKVINDMRYSDAIPKLYAALFATGVIGYTYNYALIKLENYIIHWKGYA